MLLPHRPDVKLEHVEAGAAFLASFERREGLQQAVIHRCMEWRQMHALGAAAGSDPQVLGVDADACSTA